MKILIIGGDSYVAKNCINTIKNQYRIKAISREKTNFKNELVLKDFFSIRLKEFIDLDIVFNCAGIVHRKKAPDELYMKINYELVRDLARKAKEAGVKKFIQMSTVSVYGKRETITLNTPEEPINMYGKSKYLADNALLEIQDENFKVIIIRSPMIYGADAPGNMMSLIRLVDKCLFLPFKNINNKRDFIYIKNLIHFINQAIDRDYSGKLLVSDGEPVSTEKIVKLIKKEMNRKNILLSIPFIFRSIIKKLKPDLYWKLFENLRINNTFVVKHLGINLHFKFEDGLKNMVQEYIKKRA